MTVNAALRLMAGTVVIISLLLSIYVHPNWLYLTGFVGFNLLQSAFSGWCPAVTIFKAMGLKQTTCNIHGMSVDQGVHIIAGTLILVSVASVLWLNVGTLWLAVTAIVGVSLLQSSFTGWCLAMSIARLLGFKDTQPIH